MEIEFSLLTESFNACFNYLIRSIKKDGSFVYEINFQTGRMSSGYNLLRHAGSLYALYQSINAGLRNADDNSWHLMEQAVNYLEERCLPFDGPGHMYCAVENNQVKLGGSALVLLALVERYKAGKGKDAITMMRKIASFIVSMQQPSGRFISKLYYDTREIDEDFECVYYPGEAILSLIRLYETDHDPKWLESAVKGADHLVKNPIISKGLARGHNHWFAIALSELYAIVPDEKYYREYWMIAESTAISVYQCMSLQDRTDRRKNRMTCCAMSTRGEALVAGIPVELTLKNYHKVKELTWSLAEVLKYCLFFQVRDNNPLIDYDFGGGLKEHYGRDNIRIDYVQHYMSILVNLLAQQPALKELFIFAD